MVPNKAGEGAMIKKHDDYMYNILHVPNVHVTCTQTLRHDKHTQTQAKLHQAPAKPRSKTNLRNKQNKKYNSNWWHNLPTIQTLPAYVFI